MDVVNQVEAAGLEGNWESAAKENYLIHCPYCQHHKLKLSVKSDTGAFKCWVCGESGSGARLLKKLGLWQEKEEETTEGYLEWRPEWEHEKADEYLQSRGLSNEWGWGYSETEKCVLIPYYDEHGGLVAIQKKWPDKGQYRFSGNPGLYVPDLERYNESKEVTVVEGAEDALALQSLGVNAVALGGATKLQLLDNIQHKTIYLAFDKDAAGRKASKEAQEKLGRRARIIDLPAKDANEWLQKGGTENEWKELERDAKRFSSGLVARASDFTERLITGLTEVDKKKGQDTGIASLDKKLGGGKRKGELTILQAVPKTGKSSLYHKMIQMWADRGIKVGYASREMRPESNPLVQMLSLSLGQNLYKAETLTEELTKKITDKLSQWKETVYFSEGYGQIKAEDLETWMQELHELGVDYFFIDHLHYCLQDEESRSEISNFIRRLKTLTIELNVHVDLIIQPTKLYDGGKVSNQTLRGSAALNDTMDNLLLLNREDPEEHITELSLDRARFPMARPGSLYLQYNPDTFDFIEVDKTTIIEDNDNNGGQETYQMGKMQRSRSQEGQDKRPGQSSMGGSRDYIKARLASFKNRNSF